MGVYEKYIVPGVFYARYVFFLLTLMIFIFQIRKLISDVNCRTKAINILLKPLIPGVIFVILFAWKEIDSFVRRKGSEPEVVQEPEPEVVQETEVVQEIEVVQKTECPPENMKCRDLIGYNVCKKGAIKCNSDKKTWTCGSCKGKLL